MRRCIVLMVYLCLALYASGQNTPIAYYLHDTSISDEQGHPKEQYVYYFPFSDTTDDGPGYYKWTRLNERSQQYLSDPLWTLKEPVLSNYYIGHDMYRFTRLPSLVNYNEAITIHRMGDSVWLHVAEVIYAYEPPKGINKWFEKYPDKGSWGWKERTKKLSLVHWNYFMELLRDQAFWQMSTHGSAMGCDGEDWILEAHTKEKYHAVVRWGADEGTPFYRCADYLMRLAEPEPTGKKKRPDVFSYDGEQKTNNQWWLVYPDQ